MQEKILVVDDEKEIADLIEVYLTSDGFEVFKFYNAEEALCCVEREEVDLAVLDVMLPDMDGFSLCRKIRQSHYFPIIMVTAKSEDVDKITGLTQGADDYITKPFGVMELISRVRALLRRCTGLEEERLLTAGEISLDGEKRTVYAGGRLCSLTYKEYELLKLLLQNRGIVMRREVIMERIWDISFEGESRTLDVHVKTLRQKLGDAGALIRTIRNVGYKIE